LPAVRVMRGVKVALATGLALLAAAIGITLLQSPISVAGTNGIPQEEAIIAVAQRGTTYCQAQEHLPRGTSAIRLGLSATTGPRLSLVVTSGRRVVTSGVRDAGWTTRGVTVPVTPLPRAISEARICVSFPPSNEMVLLYGRETSPSIAASVGQQALPGRFWIEYLRPGKGSWASLAPSVARRMGLGRAGAGIWIVLLTLALMMVVATLASNLVLRELR
jgi:hypothetical protein